MNNATTISPATAEPRGPGVGSGLGRLALALALSVALCATVFATASNASTFPAVAAPQAYCSKTAGTIQLNDGYAPVRGSYYLVQIYTYNADGLYHNVTGWREMQYVTNPDAPTLFGGPNSAASVTLDARQNVQPNRYYALRILYGSYVNGRWTVSPSSDAMHITNLYNNAFQSMAWGYWCQT